MTGPWKSWRPKAIRWYKSRRKKARYNRPRNPEVSAACCLYRKEKITAVYAGTLTKKELVPRLKACIPDYMVPQVFLQLEELPLSKNGKIDRQAVLTAAEAADKRRSK